MAISDEKKPASAFLSPDILSMYESNESLDNILPMKSLLGNLQPEQRSLWLQTIRETVQALKAKVLSPEMTGGGNISDHQVCLMLN